MIKLTYRSLFVYSIKSKKSFYTDFDSRFNIVHGRNTSGKSTLIQSIVYAMGINDSKDKLRDILVEDAVFRLDCMLCIDAQAIELTFVRKDDTIVVQYAGDNPSRFDGISANNSYEYVRYKEYISNLLSFGLKLQSKGELVNAPLEAAMLPYYVSQSVGWVYLRESIGDYRFYKDFKFDYLDYYTGVIADEERTKKTVLLNEKKSFEFEKSQLNKYKHNSIALRITEALDERFSHEALDYLERYNHINRQLTENEKKYTEQSNKIMALRMRQSVLSKIMRNMDKQKPQIDACPTCEQTLPGDLRDFYHYTQDLNDTSKEKTDVNTKIKKIEANLLSTGQAISRLRSEITVEYDVLIGFQKGDVSFDVWLDYRANLKLLQNIAAQKIEIDDKISKIKKRLGALDSEDDIEALREKFESKFYKLFKGMADKLRIRIPVEKRYRELYSISSFPFQGVELHKTIMAYHFAFNTIIMTNNKIHRLPFLLDAIFKEDIDKGSRKDILNFIASESPKDSQVIFTVAEFKEPNDDRSLESLFDVNRINKKYFDGKAKNICIGDAISERAFLSSSKFTDDEYIENTFRLLETL